MDNNYEFTINPEIYLAEQNISNDAMPLWLICVEIILLLKMKK